MNHEQTNDLVLILSAFICVHRRLDRPFSSSLRHALGGASRQSTRAPVALMTFVHFTFSSRMNWLNSAGVVP